MEQGDGQIGTVVQYGGRQIFANISMQYLERNRALTGERGDSGG